MRFDKSAGMRYWNDFPFPGESLDLLGELKGKSIAGIARLALSSMDYFLRNFPMEDARVFSNCDGPVLLTIDKEFCVAFDSSSRDNSITMRRETVPLSEKELAKKCKNFGGGRLIDSTEKQFGDTYCAGLSGQKIRDLSIITVENDPEAVPQRNERGLLIKTEEQELLLSFRLLEQSMSCLRVSAKEEFRKELDGRIRFIDV